MHVNAVEARCEVLDADRLPLHQEVQQVYDRARLLIAANFNERRFHDHAAARHAHLERYFVATDDIQLVSSLIGERRVKLSIALVHGNVV